jgi:hypothetical protein
VNLLCRACCIFALVALWGPAQAESLRCNGQFTSEGDTRVAVLFKCGEPLLKDSFCAPVYVQGSLHPLPQPLASTVVACQQVDEWLYDRGPGNLVAVVRFRGGVVTSIRYGRAPE